MGKVVWWEDSPVTWQTVKIAGVALPGWAKVTGDIERQVKRDLVPGKDGYTYNHLGYKGARITVMLVMYEREHLAAWITIAKTLRPNRGEKDAQPIDVYHPALVTLGIQSLYVMKIGIPEPCSNPKGAYQVKLEFEEFIREAQRYTKARQAKKSIGKGSIIDSSGYTQPTAIPTAPSQGGAPGP